MYKSIRNQREPFESEIQEEMEEEYERLHAKNDTDDDANDSLETRMQELEGMMEASTEQLEDKIEASNNRLESKIDESNRRLEAMLRELIGHKASHTDSTVPLLKEPLVTATPVVLQVTPTPTTTTEKRRATSPTHGASGVSDRSGDDEHNIGAEKEGGGPSVDKAVAGIEDKGEAAAGTTDVDEVVEVNEDVHTPLLAAKTAEVIEVLQVNFVIGISVSINSKILFI